MLADKGYDPKMGARPLSRKIDELIRVPLSKKILFEQLRDADIDADLIDDKVVFVASRTYNPVDSRGMINIGDTNA
jgi:ATP-dependent Clp protease ATP-binding subunit ClpA